MRRTRLVGWPLAIAAGAAVSMGPPAHSQGTTTEVTMLRTAGAWNLDDRSTSVSDLPSRDLVVNSTAGRDGDFPGFGGTTSVEENQAPVYLDTGHSAYFPGWHDLTSGPCPTPDASRTCDFVVADASLAHVADPTNRLSPGRVPASGGSGQFWSVQVDIRADPLTVETSRPTTWDNAANPFGVASPNIIQQGLATAGGQWKVSQHPHAGSSQLYTVSCDFKDSNNVGRTVNPGSTTWLSAGLDYRVRCALLPGGIPRLTIWRKGVTAPVVDERGSYPAAAYTVNPSDDVYIGKKSSRMGGTAALVHTNDAYAGYLDNIVIRTTPPAP